MGPRCTRRHRAAAVVFLVAWQVTIPVGAEPCWRPHTNRNLPPIAPPTRPRPRRFRPRPTPRMMAAGRRATRDKLQGTGDKQKILDSQAKAKRCRPVGREAGTAAVSRRECRCRVPVRTLPLRRCSWRRSRRRSRLAGRAWQHASGCRRVEGADRPAVPSRQPPSRSSENRKTSVRSSRFWRRTARSSRRRLRRRCGLGWGGLC